MLNDRLFSERIGGAFEGIQQIELLGRMSRTSEKRRRSFARCGAGEDHRGGALIDTFLISRRCSWCCRGPEQIADARLGDDILRLGRVDFYLLAQLTHVDPKTLRCHLVIP